MDPKAMTYQEAYEKRLRRMRPLSKYSDMDLNRVIEEGREKLYSWVFRDIGGYSLEANKYIFDRWAEHADNDIRSRLKYWEIFGRAVVLARRLFDGGKKPHDRDMFISDLIEEMLASYEPVEGAEFLVRIRDLAFHDAASLVYDRMFHGSL